MATLWIRFSDEASLPPSFTDREKKKLEEIYDAANANSVWNRAAARLGMPKGGGALLRWHRGAPYINWNMMVNSVTCGTAEAVPAEDGGFTYKPHNTPLKIFALLKCQWRMAQYVDERLKAELPKKLDDKITESTALGLALQALMLRLPRHSPQDFASWLAAPDKSPPRAKRTVMQIADIQKRRTKLSAAWLEIFPTRDGPDPNAPEHFWDNPPESPLLWERKGPVAERREGEGTPSGASQPFPKEGEQEWKGLPVCAGQVTGRAMLVTRIKDFKPPGMGDSPILVFPRARPDTVELFPHAAALLFAEGGALSHACTVAREQGIPCVTGLGQGFLAAITESGKFWLSVDGAAGSVRVVEVKE